MASTPKKFQQYFGLDLVDEGTERTLWTHKPSAWEDLFNKVQEFAKNGKVASVSSMFNGIFACPLRAVPKGPSEIQTFLTAKGQHIQHWIMLVPMPADIDFKEYIHEFISKFQAVCKKPFIRAGYKNWCRRNY